MAAMHLRWRLWPCLLAAALACALVLPAAARDGKKGGKQGRPEPSEQSEGANGPGRGGRGEQLLEEAREKFQTRDFPAAERLAEEVLARRERKLGPDHPSLTPVLTLLANVQRAQGHFAAAEPLLRRGLAIREKALDPDRPALGQSLAKLADLLRDEGRYGEAAPLYQRAVAILEKARGPDDPAVAAVLADWAFLLQLRGQAGRAEPLFRRALAIREAALGPDHPDVARSLNQLANLLRMRRRYDEAAPLFEQAETTAEKALGGEHPLVAQILNSHATLLRVRGDNAGAEPLYRRALAIREKIFGPNHPSLGLPLLGLAGVLAATGKNAEAEALFRRALAIREKVFGPMHPDIAASLSGLAQVLQAEGKHDEALKLSRRAVAILSARSLTASSVPTDSDEGAQPRQRIDFIILVDLLSQLPGAAGPVEGKAADEAFQTAQMASGSNTARALAAMAARFAAGSDALAQRVRQYQDALARRQAMNAALADALAQPSDHRNLQAEADLRRQIAEFDKDLAAVNARLHAEFPRYDEIANPRPLSVADVQDLLQDGEALVAWTVATNQSFVFAISRDRARLARLDLRAEDLHKAVLGLRSALNPTNKSIDLNALPRFNLGKAHELYVKLLAPVAPVLAQAKHVFLIPDRALQSLPLEVLVTERPHGPIEGLEDYRKVPWLARRYAMTVLPGVSSLRALRAFAERTHGAAPFIGFGDPDLQGAAAGSGARGPVTDFDEVRRLSPLPETALELKAQAAALKVPASNLYLGKAATETAVKRTDLHEARILAFATHGLLAGDLANLAEPALVLTPPATPTREDDGLLTASEAAQLKLNADWIVLSACNTAASDGSEGAEGLSGLAKAFFYAGARSLLVSHWPVDSAAAVALTTGAFKALEREPQIGRAEALRRSILRMIEQAGQNGEPPYFAHPMFWAPFVLVGEGGAGR